MHILYVCRMADGTVPHGKSSDPFILRCARDFLDKSRTDRGRYPETADSLTVYRTPEGKPELTAHGLSVSVSNTKKLWLCLIADSACGLDYQDIGTRTAFQLEKLAGRFFLPEEADAVKNKGKREFYRIWTRKESLGKLLGKGMFPAFPMPVLRDAEAYGFQDVQIPDADGVCTICLRDQSERAEPAEIVCIQAEAGMSGGEIDRE